MVSNDDLMEVRIHKYILATNLSPANPLTCCYVWTTNIHAQGTAKPRLAQLELLSCSLQEQEDFRTDSVTGNLVPKPSSAGNSGNCSYKTIGKAQASL